MVGLVKRFGQQTIAALQRFHSNADITRPTVANSLLDIIDKREYLKTESERFVERVCERIKNAVPTMFARQRPKDEK
jgi:hypothetical protein